MTQMLKSVVQKNKKKKQNKSLKILLFLLEIIKDGVINKLVSVKQSTMIHLRQSTGVS